MTQPLKFYNVTYEYIHDLEDPNQLVQETNVLMQGHLDKFKEAGHEAFRRFRVIKTTLNTDMIEINGIHVPYKKRDKQFASCCNLTIPNKYYWKNWNDQITTIKKMIKWFEDNNRIAPRVLFSLINNTLKVRAG
jgi:hypothetical protein